MQGADFRWSALDFVLSRSESAAQVAEEAAGTVVGIVVVVNMVVGSYTAEADIAKVDNMESAAAVG